MTKMNYTSIGLYILGAILIGVAVYMMFIKKVDSKLIPAVVAIAAMGSLGAGYYFGGKSSSHHKDDDDDDDKSGKQSIDDEIDNM
jgi:hypothetical protein